jgi:hypothetical protein
MVIKKILFFDRRHIVEHRPVYKTLQLVTQCPCALYSHSAREDLVMENALAGPQEFARPPSSIFQLAQN